MNFAADAMIRLTRSGPLFSSDPKQLGQAREVFKRERALVLRGFLDRGLVEQICEYLESDSFVPQDYEKVGKEDRIEIGPSLWALDFLMNNSDIFRCVESLTECSAIKSFVGRIYRQVPGAEHFSNWHDDAVDSRLIALSINLSRDRYEGGELEIRAKATGAIVTTVAGLALGDGNLFQINDDLQHRTRPVDGECPRIHFAGWFRSEPKVRSYRSFI